MDAERTGDGAGRPGRGEQCRPDRPPRSRTGDEAANRDSGDGPREERPDDDAEGRAANLYRNPERTAVTERVEGGTNRRIEEEKSRRPDGDGGGMTEDRGDDERDDGWPLAVLGAGVGGERRPNRRRRQPEPHDDEYGRPEDGEDGWADESEGCAARRLGEGDGDGEEAGAVQRGADGRPEGGHVGMF